MQNKSGNNRGWPTNIRNDWGRCGVGRRKRSRSKEKGPKNNSEVIIGHFGGLFVVGYGVKEANDIF